MSRCQDAPSAVLPLLGSGPAAAASLATSHWNTCCCPPALLVADGREVAAIGCRRLANFKQVALVNFEQMVVDSRRRRAN